MAAALDMTLAAAPAPATAAPAQAPLEAEQFEMAFAPRFWRPVARSE